jgi:hypothetical protein
MDITSCMGKKESLSNDDQQFYQYQQNNNFSKDLIYGV